MHTIQANILFYVHKPIQSHTLIVMMLVNRQIKGKGLLASASLYHIPFYLLSGLQSTQKYLLSLQNYVACDLGNDSNIDRLNQRLA